MYYPTVGMRVGALATAHDGIVFLFGYGTYQGEEIPPDEGGGSMTGILHAAGRKNPKILLDSGEVVWGCECWWDSEEGLKESIQRGDLIVVEMTVADFRAGRFPQVMTETPMSDFWTA
jgi:hypothetical protein